MISLKVSLKAALVDNPVSASASTKVDIKLENSTGRLKIEDCESGARSAHRFTVTNAQDVGCNEIHNLSEDEASQILAIACSLIAPRLFFSFIQPEISTASLSDHEATSSSVSVTKNPDGAHVEIAETMKISDSLSTKLITSISLDESRIFEVISRLLEYRILDGNQGSLTEINVKDSIKRYWDAANAVNQSACHTLLYNALEKAVTADGERTGKNFDKAAHQLTGVKETKIEELRGLNNRIKHRQRGPDDTAIIASAEKNLPLRTKSLKCLADKAILSRLRVP